MKIIVLSDCHIGSPEANHLALKKFLVHLVCDRLILLGDFWDMSAKNIRKKHKEFIDVLKIINDRGTKITYLLGNHDDFYLDDPIMSNDVIEVVPYFSMRCGTKHISFVHGHEFDHCYQNTRWFMRLEAWINKQAREFFGISAKNFMRRPTCTDLAGKPEYNHVIDSIHEVAINDCSAMGFNARIMGHTHKPVHLQDTPQGVEFVNAGDWKWSNTYVEIDDEGRIDLMEFD